MRKSIALAGILIVSACQTVDKGAVTACSGYAVALSTLANLRVANKLDQPTIDKVNAAVAVAHPVCSLPSPPKLDTATESAVSSAVAQLVSIAQQGK